MDNYIAYAIWTEGLDTSRKHIDLFSDVKNKLVLSPKKNTIEKRPYKKKIKKKKNDILIIY